MKEHAPTIQCSNDDCLGLGKFARDYWQGGDVYQNESKLFWKMLGSRQLIGDVKCFSWNPFKIYQAWTKIMARMAAKGVEHNLKGEGLLLGGIAVFGEGECRFLYGRGARAKRAQKRCCC